MFPRNSTSWLNGHSLTLSFGYLHCPHKIFPFYLNYVKELVVNSWFWTSHDGRILELLLLRLHLFSKNLYSNNAQLKTWFFSTQAFLEARLHEVSQRPGRSTHYIFTDSDIAVVDDLGQIFRDFPNFHLALTFRNNKAQPLNSGFIAVRGTADGILRFLSCYLVFLFCSSSIC